MIGVLLKAKGRGYVEVERKPWDTTAGVWFEVNAVGHYRIALEDANGARLALSTVEPMLQADTITLDPMGIA